MNNTFNFNYGERYFAEGVSVSNDTHRTGVNNNDLIIGGSGSGKTTGYVSHLLLNPYGSMVISDTKGTLCRKFSTYLRAKGYQVHVVDFCNPENSVGYNPLQYIRQNRKGLPNESDIKKLASVMVAAHNKEDAYWVNMARRYVSMIVSYVLEALPEEEHNMLSVLKVHHLMQTEITSEFMDEWCEINPDSFSAKKYTDMRDTRKAEKVWSSMMEFANEAMDPFDNSELESVFASDNSLDFTMLGKENTVVFLNSSDHDRSMDMVCNIFNMQIIQTLIDEADRHKDGRLEVPCRIILDDFAASTPIEDFDNLISIIRSREISVSIIIQSISQLNSKYNSEVARTITNNCAHTLY